MQETARDVRWKWALLGLCALFAFWTFAYAADQYGIASRPWFGWWDILDRPSGQPFVLESYGTDRGGAGARAGIRQGDWADLREESFATRVYMFGQPIVGRPLAVVAHRGPHRYVAWVRASTVLQGNALSKAWAVIPALIVGCWFVGCAFLIALRRAATREGRLLALACLCAAIASGAGGGIAVPSPVLTMLLFALEPACALVAILLLVVLSVGLGVRSTLRRVLEGCAYAAIGLCALDLLAFVYGLSTLRIDPLRVGWNNLSDGGTTAILLAIAGISVVLLAIVTVASAPRPGKARVAWLILPLPFALLIWMMASNLFIALTDVWVVYQGMLIVGEIVMLLGASFVTYALLKQRVLDLEFVLSRALVFTALSAIVVAAFVLLEWFLGVVVTGVSHATGLVANAALALVLGVSMNYIHQRVDALVDASLFRKRYEDERALREFGKEAAYVTDAQALLDRAIAALQRHTDARGAALLLLGSDRYAAVRSFGHDDAEAAGENDGAVLALKARRECVDLRLCDTALHGGFAFPMLARGQLLGMLVLGERTGGEAYAPDEIDAIAQLAHGVGTALDVLTVKGEGPVNALEPILRALASLGEKIDMLPQRIAAISTHPLDR